MEVHGCRAVEGGRKSNDRFIRISPLARHREIIDFASCEPTSMSGPSNEASPKSSEER
ncbi:6802_t:CDS:2 [Acaulospora colombiana]|uniref:6802_t:CDS:1 n=1 Tax=Acaulospora colombiana TaxID=27376 RepID=A0ACA9M0A5_9GLOM|nr:6802_t:CDS:2 [Acaulospora colombiana]